MSNISKYKKLIAAIVGLVAIVIGPELLNLTDTPEKFTEAVLALLTAFGVYQLKND